LDTSAATVLFVADTHISPIDWGYAGARKLNVLSVDEGIKQILELGIDSSGRKLALLKNFKERVLKELSEKEKQELPSTFLTNTPNHPGCRVGIIPKNRLYCESLSSPYHPQFHVVINEIYEKVALFLNTYFNHSFKITPDFGSFTKVADIINVYTPDCLTISQKHGGLNKSRCTAAGFIGGIHVIGNYFNCLDHATPINVIGAGGALGTVMMEWLREKGYCNVTLCDLRFDAALDCPTQTFLPQLPSGWKIVKSSKGIPKAMQERGGLIVCFAYENELRNSNLSHFKPGTVLVFGQNHSLPPGEEGKQLVKTLAEQNVTVFDGSSTTVGGSASSVIEWDYRTDNPGQPMSEKVLKASEAFLTLYTQTIVREICKRACSKNIPPYFAYLEMLSDLNIRTFSEYTGQAKTKTAKCFKNPEVPMFQLPVDICAIPKKTTQLVKEAREAILTFENSSKEVAILRSPSLRDSQKNSIKISAFQGTFAPFHEGHLSAIHLGRLFSKADASAVGISLTHEGGKSIRHPLDIRIATSLYEAEKSGVGLFLMRNGNPNAYLPALRKAMEDVLGRTIFFDMILGSDLALKFYRNKPIFDFLSQNACVTIVKRAEEQDLSLLLKKWKEATECSGYGVTLVENTGMENISSTQIADGNKKGQIQDVREMLDCYYKTFK